MENILITHKVYEMFLENNNVYFVIGGQKCGTSSLYYTIVQNNREYIISSKDDLNFFLKNLNASDKIYIGSDDIYKEENLFKIISYCAVNNYIAHFIILIREPVERAISHILHILRKKKKNYLTNHEYQTVVNHSKFQFHINNLVKMLGSNNHVVVSSYKFIDEIKSNNSMIIESIFPFLPNATILHENSSLFGRSSTYTTFVSHMGNFIKKYFGLNIYFLVRKFNLHRFFSQNYLISFENIDDSASIKDRLTVDLESDINWYANEKTKSYFFHSGI